MSKAVKKVLTVAAAIAVAYFAPQVSAALLKGTTFAASTAASVVTTAAVNAAGNAAIAAATGGDVGKAAIAGAITGGLQGYLQAPINQLKPVEVTGVVKPGYTTPADISAGRALNVAEGQAFTAGGASAPAAVTPAAGVLKAVDTTAAAAPTASLGSRALAAVQEAGGAIVDKFTNPQAIADLTLRAAGQLAGSAIAGSGLSPAEQKLLAAQAADLEELKRTNQDLYNLRLEQAKALLGEAARDYGFETEQRARVATGAQTVAGLRGLTGERRRAEQARLRRAAQEQISTARAQGELIGAERTQQARVAGLNALPAPPQGGIMEARRSLMDMYGVGETRRQQQAGQVGDFLGAFTGKQQAGLAGFSLSDLEKETQRRRFGNIA